MCKKALYYIWSHFNRDHKTIWPIWTKQYWWIPCYFPYTLVFITLQFPANKLANEAEVSLRGTDIIRKLVAK